MYSLGCLIYELFNFNIYYNDREYEEIKTIDSKKYNIKWQEIINSLLQINYNDRMNINQVYNIILNEIYKNFILGEIYIDKENINKDIQIINSFENLKKEGKLNVAKDYEYDYENEKEIKENIEIKIEGKIIGFSYYYKFKK